MNRIPAILRMLPKLADSSKLCIGVLVYLAFGLKGLSYCLSFYITLIVFLSKEGFYIIEELGLLCRRWSDLRILARAA